MPYITITLDSTVTPAARGRIQSTLHRLQQIDPDMNGAEIDVRGGDYTAVDCDADPILAARLYRSIVDTIDEVRP